MQHEGFSKNIRSCILDYMAFCQEDDNINVDIRENFKSHIDVIVSVAIERCHNCTSIPKSWQFICMQRYIHCKEELY